MTFNVVYESVQLSMSLQIVSLKIESNQLSGS